jgi:protein tyrosine/serine phosphatase
MANLNHRAFFVPVSRRIQAVLLMFVFALAGATANAADKGDKDDFKIKNFGQVDENHYRGAQPKQAEHFQALAAMGIKTIINLRDDNVEQERALVEAAGMRYISIPMDDKSMPTADMPLQFLQTMKDQENGPYYVHCAGGRHRTGVMVAVYRINNYQWDIEKAYDEMKQYDFYTRWGHGVMKDFIYSYYKGMHRKEVTPATAIEAETQD